MTDVGLLSAMQEMLYYVMVGVSIVTIPVLIVGLVLSIVQAATQINEMTLTFIPKFLVMFVLLTMATPWLMSRLIHLLQHFLLNLPLYIR